MIKSEVNRPAPPPVRAALGSVLLWLMGNFHTSPARAQLPADNPIVLVQQAAREQLAMQAAAGKMLEPLFDVTLANTTRAIPQCGQKPTVEAVDTRQPNRMRLALVCGDRPAWRIEFVARAVITAKVAVAALPVAAGQTLDGADLTLERRDISAVPDSTAELATLLGLSSKRALRAGEIVRVGQLSAPLLVKRGEPVRIVARREQIEVSMAGEALDAGARDATVRVRNSTSGSVIRARVTGAGVVQPVEVGSVTQSPD